MQFHLYNANLRNFLIFRPWFNYFSVPLHNFYVICIGNKNRRDMIYVQKWKIASTFICTPVFFTKAMTSLKDTLCVLNECLFAQANAHLTRMFFKHNFTRPFAPHIKQVSQLETTRLICSCTRSRLIKGFIKYPNLISITSVNIHKQ